MQYIKYKRIREILTVDEINELFDSFIRDGWEIINYHEEHAQSYEFFVTIIIGKKQIM